MTQPDTTCPRGPNNFAMIPRIARLELNGNEFLLYATYVDIANPNTSRAQMSNKRLANAVGCTVKTLKKHRNRLQELGYIRLFYRDTDGNSVELDSSTEVETSVALIVEIVDIWQANCQFAEALKQSRNEKIATLKNFLPSQMETSDEESMQGEVKNYPLIEENPDEHMTPVVGKNVDGGVKKIPPTEVDITVAGEVKNYPHKIHKDLLKEKVKEIKNTSAERGDDSFLPVLDEIFGDDESDTPAEALVTEMDLPEANITDDEPAGQVMESVDIQGCTPQEFEHFADSVSGDLLETHVFNPCHNTFMPRADFPQPTVTHTDWQQLIAVVQHFFGISKAGYAATIAQQLAGTATSGLRKDFACDPPMDAVTACAFAYWLREVEGLDKLPQRAERIRERAYQFRELPDVFAHVNYARYVLAEILAQLEPDRKPEIDPKLLEPAPKDVLDKAYAEAEALLGFSLSGDF